MTGGGGGGGGGGGTLGSNVDDISFVAGERLEPKTGGGGGGAGILELAIGANGMSNLIGSSSEDDTDDLCTGGGGGTLLFGAAGI